MIEKQLEKEKIQLETSQIPWRELQRFFASGLTIWVSEDVDLIEVAYAFSQDNTSTVQKWLINQKIMFVQDNQALEWFENDVDVWAVVVKPWILIQSIVVKTV